jgi:hypothetical protein
MFGMGKTLGVMLTMTTYGTWLRGDRRGWVDDGKIMPADPGLEDMGRGRMDYPPFFLSTAQQIGAGALMGRALCERLGSPLWAMVVESWHVHLVTGPMGVPIGEAVKEIKLAVLHGLHVGRPMWSDGYDKRWCFDAQAVAGRIGYVERHNVKRGLPARRWGMIEDCPYV